MHMDRNDSNPPAAGLQGDFEGTCIVCLRPTDTGLAFKGDGDFLVAGLTVLGLPMDEAAATVSYFFGIPPGTVPSGVRTLTIQVCKDCVAKTSLPAPVLAFSGAALPCIQQPPEDVME